MKEKLVRDFQIRLDWSKMRLRICLIGVLALCGVIKSFAQVVREPVQQTFEVTIKPGRSLMSDNKNPYRNGVDGIMAFGNYSAVVCTDRRTCGTIPRREHNDAMKRALVLDLRESVASSAAKNLGVVRAAGGSFGAFWEQDKTQRTVINGREGFVIRSVNDLKTGSTVESQRIEIRFFLNGGQHILQFGPWTAGQYQLGQGAYHGEGTTQGTIERASETEWIVRSGPNSIGRLWNNGDPAHPVDLGLYRFSFEVQFVHK